ncbi:MAG TPA: protein kinase [Vicinamibacterales bacterium]|nr:protein kinase [Vicinamibacterales bacterium]
MTESQRPDTIGHPVDSRETTPLGRQRSMSGTQFGPYRIDVLIGAGAMGEVYRARDTRLGRDVALKVLPESFAHDVDRRVRFEREARMLAAVSHPHIASIHGVEEAGGIVALILEMVEGPTLADRLQRGPLPQAEALTIARQIAEAVDAAHEKGIIHRDLKPANIKLAPDRAVKVLDFGLAKAFEGDHGAADLSHMPTVTAAGTRAGAIMGTAAYMSPEQARGQPVDKRTDIWAFGCVLYEMLTARLAFAGKTFSDTIVAILEREPDWHALPESTPAHIRRLLRRCLDKDPRRRFRDIGDVAIELASDPSGDLAAAADSGTPRKPWLWLALAGLALVGATAAVAAVVFSRPAAPTSSINHAVRFSIPPPEGAAFGGGLPDVEVTYLALSPDGSQLAFVAAGSADPTRVWIRPLSGLEARPIAGTEGAISAFWSPDSRSLGFFAAGKLKRVDLPGGTPVSIAEVPAGGGLLGTWGRGGQIVFGSIQGNEIWRVSTGGDPAVGVVKADSSRGEVRLYWPWFLPDGQRFLYLATRKDGTGDLRIFEPGRPTRSLLAVVSNVQWVDPDYLVFAREGTLLAQRVDLSAGRVTGDPFAIADAVNYSYLPSRAMFTTSQNGVVVFQAHRDVARLAWIDRSGKEIATIGSPGGYYALRLSPDRKQVLFTRRDPRYGTHDLWLLDLSRGNETVITSGPPPELPGPWFPGQQAFVFNSARGGPPNLFQRDMRTGKDHELLPAGSYQLASDITPDGKQLLISHRAERGTWDILILQIGAGAAPTPLYASPFSEFDPRLSPNGRAVAFTSMNRVEANCTSRLFRRPRPRSACRPAEPRSPAGAGTAGNSSISRLTDGSWSSRFVRSRCWTWDSRARSSHSPENRGTTSASRRTESSFSPSCPTAWLASSR